MKEKKKNVNETNRRRTHSVLYTDWYAKQRRSESGVRSNFTRGEKKPNANTHTYEFSQWKVSVIVRFFFRMLLIIELRCLRISTKWMFTFFYMNKKRRRNKMLIFSIFAYSRTFILFYCSLLDGVQMNVQKTNCMKDCKQPTETKQSIPLFQWRLIAEEWNKTKMGTIFYWTIYNARFLFSMLFFRHIFSLVLPIFFPFCLFMSAIFTMW